MEHSTEVLYNRTMVYCTPEHRFGSDALLLARFCEPKRSQKAADLCSGCGIVALEWHDRGHRGPCTALELQPEGSALLAAAVEEQQLTHIIPVCADLRTWRQDEGQFDVCACNPPYFTEGPQSKNAAHALARHENTCALEDVCACGFRLLKDGGRLALCHRPGAAGRGAGCAARPPAGTQAAGLCKERPGKRPVAVPCGSPEEP